MHSRIKCKVRTMIASNATLRLPLSARCARAERRRSRDCHYASTQTRSTQSETLKNRTGVNRVSRSACAVAGIRCRRTCRGEADRWGRWGATGWRGVRRGACVLSPVTDARRCVLQNAGPYSEKKPRSCGDAKVKSTIETNGSAVHSQRGRRS